jgi:hypothetical protein
MAGLHTVWIKTDEMQERFEEEGFREPEFFGVSIEEISVAEPGPNAPEMPFGSKSVELSYRVGNRGQERATAHVYKYPDGSYRGTPDPKSLRIGNTQYLLDDDP